MPLDFPIRRYFTDLFFFSCITYVPRLEDHNNFLQMDKAEGHAELESSPTIIFVLNCEGSYKNLIRGIDGAGNI